MRNAKKESILAKTMDSSAYANRKKFIKQRVKNTEAKKNKKRNV